MNNSRAEAIDSAGLLRNAPAVSSAELSIKIARRCGAPKKLAGPPPPTIPTRNLRSLILSSPGVDVGCRHVTIAKRRGIASGESRPGEKVIRPGPLARVGLPPVGEFLKQSQD